MTDGLILSFLDFLKALALIKGFLIFVKCGFNEDCCAKKDNVKKNYQTLFYRISKYYIFFGEIRKKVTFPKKSKYLEVLFINMIIDENSRVGKRGEILPKKPLREFSGIKPGDNILIEAQPGRLIINKIFSVEELLEMPIISQGTAESIEKEIAEELKNQEELTNNEH